MKIDIKNKDMTKFVLIITLILNIIASMAQFIVTGSTEGIAKGPIILLCVTIYLLNNTEKNTDNTQDAKVLNILLSIMSLVGGVYGIGYAVGAVAKIYIG